MNKKIKYILILTPILIFMVFLNFRHHKFFYEDFRKQCFTSQDNQELMYCYYIMLNNQLASTQELYDMYYDQPHSQKNGNYYILFEEAFNNCKNDSSCNTRDEKKLLIVKEKYSFNNMHLNSLK